MKKMFHFLNGIKKVKAFILFYFLVFQYTTTSAQIYCDFVGYGYANRGYLQITNYVDNDVSRIGYNIFKTLNVRPIPVTIGSVDNAAYYENNGFARIIYNQRFFNQLRNEYGYWGMAGVLAHEVGHYIDCSKFYNISSWAKELKADFVAGYVLRLMGATIEEALYFQDSIFDLRGSDTHPDGCRRINATKQGYYYQQ